MEPSLDRERQQAHALVEALSSSLALASVEEEELTPETAENSGRVPAAVQPFSTPAP